MRMREPPRSKAIEPDAASAENSGTQDTHTVGGLLLVQILIS
jgi:hypothetical protein